MRIVSRVLRFAGAPSRSIGAGGEVLLPRSVPGAGRPLTAVVNPLATRTLSAASTLASEFDDEAIGIWSTLFGPRDKHLARQAPSPIQLGWTLVATWCLARI